MEATFFVRVKVDTMDMNGLLQQAADMQDDLLSHGWEVLNIDIRDRPNQLSDPGLLQG